MERNKHWRELNRRKHYIAALKRALYLRAWWGRIPDSLPTNPTWVDLYKANACRQYRTVHVVCSCEICSPHTPRSVFRKETARILREAEKELDLPSGSLGPQSFRWK